MAVFATNQDLMEYAPDVFTQGVDDWTDELAKAQVDVINQVKIKYWQKFHTPSRFNVDLLTASQWTKATVYRALSAYLLPKLATFRIDDVFVEQIKFYKERYAEEIDTQFALGIEYDNDEDGNIDDGEITEYRQDRLYR